MSVFSDKGLIEILSSKTVPVAIDQWYERRQKDTKGDFYRKIAGQGPRTDFEQTTQGMYVASAAGELLGYINHHDLSRVQQMIEDALKKYQPGNSQPIQPQSVDQEYARKLPEGGVVVRVNTRVLGGYEEPETVYRRFFQQSIARDNLWITAAEKQQLINGVLPRSVELRIAKFHLIDNTRGEPPMWQDDEVKLMECSLTDGKLTGKFQLETSHGKRGFHGEIFGHIKSNQNSLTRMDIVVKGNYWGHGRFTQAPPAGKFPIAIAFRLAEAEENDTADDVPPQGTKGWAERYWQ